ncbi:MAG: choice-of-anchor A family protein, partial [Lewinella sp.]|uniref:choice-of-anchor A family protein n=1 Tax=Lewinella sp. TaxID=2004506 RepID=UPI003D6A79AF
MSGNQTACFSASVDDVFFNFNGTGNVICVPAGVTWTQNFGGTFANVTIEIYGSVIVPNSMSFNSTTVINIYPGGSMETSSTINGPITVNNAGTFTFTGTNGQIGGQNGTTFNNLSGGVLEAEGLTGQLLLIGPVAVTNSGIMNFSSLENNEADVFDNYGEINISRYFFNHGNLYNYGDVNTACGPFGSGGCEFIVGNKGPTKKFVNNSCMTVNGNVTFNGASEINAPFQIIDGDLTINFPVTGTDGGIFVTNGSSDITVSGSYSGTNLTICDENTVGNDFDSNVGNNPSMYTVDCTDAAMPCAAADQTCDNILNNLNVDGSGPDPTVAFSNPTSPYCGTVGEYPSPITPGEQAGSPFSTISCPPMPPSFRGLDASYQIVVGGDFLVPSTGGAEVEGRLAVGGNLIIDKGYGIGESGGGTFVISDQGNAVAVEGTMSGTGTLNMGTNNGGGVGYVAYSGGASTLNVGNGTASDNNGTSIVDHTTLLSEAAHISMEMQSATATGSFNAVSRTVTGTNAAVEIINITGTDLDPGFQDNLLFADIAPGATIILNVSGAVVTSRLRATAGRVNDPEFGATGSDPDALIYNLVYNFYEATSVTVAGNLNGLVFIPNGNLDLQQNLNGRAYIGGNLTHSGSGSEIHNYPFTGELSSFCSSACTIDTDGLAGVACSGNEGISFSLTPSGTGVSGTYTVSVSGGGATSISPMMGTYDVATVFTLNDNSAGGGDVTVTITDLNGCERQVTITDPTAGLPAVAFTAPADLCIDAGVQSGLGGGTPTGGVYSGAGVTDDGNGMTYSFNPATAGVGTHTLTYTFTAANSCSVSASDDIEVFTLPVVGLTAPADLCIDAGVQSGLGGGTPTGGVYSGAGVTDDGNGMTYSFDPAAAGVGTHMLTYTFTDGNSCTSSDTDDVEVFDLPVVVFTAPADCCVTDGALTGLGSGTPTGGVYSGPGVTDDGNGMTYSFDPAAAGVGTHLLTYTFTDGNGCTNSASDDKEVFATPTAAFTAPADLCIDAGVQSGLGGGTPTGGVYSGAGVTDDGNGMTYSFDPAAAGVGTHAITYTVGANGCNDSASDDVEVFALPVVAFTAPADLCIDAGVQAGLGGGTPTGGTYSGSGVTDDGNGMTYSFDPAAAGAGTHTLTYTFTDANSCTASASDDVEVFAVPNATFTAPSDLCIDAGVQSGLGGGSPMGGVYSGPGVTDGGNGMTYSFDPATAGTGTHTITYTVGVNGCVDAATDDIEVFALPVVTLTAPADLCIDAG